MTDELVMTTNREFSLSDLFGLAHLLSDLADGSPGGRIAAEMLPHVLRELDAKCASQMPTRVTVDLTA
jgi:hypothetical protein